MSNVTSVKTGYKKPERGGAILIGFIGLGCLAGRWWVFIVGFALIALAISAWIGNKAQYSVILNTSSGENQALTSVDGSYIKAVVDALNNAIVSRG